MKRIITVISALTLAMFFAACSGSIDSDSDKGFIDPGLESSSAKTVVATGFTLAAGSCNSADPPHCHAIYYSGAINGKNYQCIAVDNYHIGGSKNYNLKIYRQGISGNWTAKARSGNTVTEETISDGDISITASTDKSTDPADISFSTAYPTLGIANGNTIAAQEYSVTED